MSITDELRKYADRLSDEAARKSEHGFSPVAMKLEGIADRIDAEHESAMYNMRREFEEWKHTQDTCYVKLPVDANGVPIRVGDVLTDGEHTFVVDELAAFGDGSWSIRNDDGNAWAACDVTHHHEQTVEDVLREFGDWYAHTKGGCDEDGILAENAELKAENAKLRELVRDAWGNGHPDRSCGDCDIRDECHDDIERLRKDGMLRFSRCLFEVQIEQRMRELGIEVGA